MLVIEVLYVLEAFRPVLCLVWVGFKEQASTSSASTGTAASCSCLRKNQGAFTPIRAPKAGFAARKVGGLMFQGRAQASEMGSEGAKPAPCRECPERSHSHRRSPEPRHCCWRWCQHPLKPMESHPRAFAGLGGELAVPEVFFPVAAELLPRREGCRGAAPPPRTPAPHSPSPGSVCVCAAVCILCN